MLKFYPVPLFPQRGEKKKSWKDHWSQWPLKQRRRIWQGSFGSLKPCKDSTHSITFMLKTMLHLLFLKFWIGWGDPPSWGIFCWTVPRQQLRWELKYLNTLHKTMPTPTKFSELEESLPYCLLADGLVVCTLQLFLSRWRSEMTQFLLWGCCHLDSLQGNRKAQKGRGNFQPSPPPSSTSGDTSEKNKARLPAT